MGSIDTVYARCPACNAKIEFQSKADECNGQEFDIRSVPITIALDINGGITTCGKMQC